MKFAKVFLLIPMCAIFVSCSKATDGVAPGSPITPPSAVLDSSDANMKYGSIVTSSSGWVINFDSTDPVKATTTATGWQVEIKYE